MKSVQFVEIFDRKATILLGEENPDTKETNAEVHNLRESASDLKDSMKEDIHNANDDMLEEILSTDIVADQKTQPIVDDPVELSTKDFTDSLEKNDQIIDLLDNQAELPNTQV